MGCNSFSTRALLIAGLLLLQASTYVREAPVSWVPNADGLWQTAANWSSNPSLPGAADDVTIDRPAVITVTLSSGVPSIRSLTSQENLIVGGLSLTIGAGGGQINGALTVGPLATLTSSGGTFQAVGAVVANSANLRAIAGGTLNLSTLTSYSSSTQTAIVANGMSSIVNLSGITSFASSTAGFTNTQIYAQAGGSVNLSALSSITTGETDAIASGAGSTIDFTNLNTFGANKFNDVRRFRAENGGHIISPNLTTISGRVSVEISGASSMLDLADLTNVNDLSFLAENNATLSLPAVITSYSSSAQSAIVANGTGSIVNLSGITSFASSTALSTNTQIYAQAGGTVNLSALSSITTGETDAIASGAGSTIDFTNLTTFSANKFNDFRRFRAENGGHIISPNLTTISGRVNVELSGASSMLDLADLTNANNLSFLAENSATLSVPVTNYVTPNGSQFRAITGGTLNLSTLTGYSSSTQSAIVANGTGSIVNLSGITSFSSATVLSTNTQIYAQAGGTVNLSALSSITTGETDAMATGAGSTIDFTNLNTFGVNKFNDTRRFRAENGGHIISPNLTTISGRVNVELSGASSMLDLADLTNANDLSFLAENSATLSLPVTNYFTPNGSQFRAITGGTLNLSTLTSYSATASSSIVANGTSSIVNLSGITSFSSATNFLANTQIYAQAGGTVNLSSLSSITTGETDAIASGAGSTIDFTNLNTFSANKSNSTRRLRAESGGAVRIKSAGITTVTNTSVETNLTGTIMGDTLAIGSGATLSGNGLIDANYTQLSGGTMRFNVGGLTADTQFDQIVIDGNATLGGTLNVILTNNFVPVFGQTFEILQVNGTITGTFDIGQYSFLTGGLQWDVIYNPHSVVLQVVNFYGDYSGNGVIDAADYVVWRKFRNATGINQPADGDRNLVVDDSDYNYWRSRFGQTSGSSSSPENGSVPEPTDYALCIMGLLVGGFRRVRLKSI